LRLRSERHHAREAADRLVVALERAQREAQVVARVDELRLRGERATQVGQGFLMPPELMQHAAGVAVRLDMVRSDAQGIQQRRQRLLVPRLADERHAERVARVG